MASVVQHDPSQSSGQRHGLKAKDRTRDISVHTYSLIVSQTVSLIQSVKHSSNTKQKCKQSIQRFLVYSAVMHSLWNVRQFRSVSCASKITSDAAKRTVVKSKIHVSFYLRRRCWSPVTSHNVYFSCVSCSLTWNLEAEKVRGKPTWILLAEGMTQTCGLIFTLLSGLSSSRDSSLSLNLDLSPLQGRN